MSNFTNPENVLSPKGVVSNVRVIFNTGEGGWSLARVEWEGNEELGIRWNGHSGNTLGNPQSRGIPTWFILPTEIARLVHQQIGADGFQPQSLPEEGDRVRLDPLPDRIWQGQNQEPRDDEWLVTRVDKLRGLVSISNSATGHYLNLYPAHMQEFIADLDTNKSAGLRRWILRLRVKVVFKDGYVTLKPPF